MAVILAGMLVLNTWFFLTTHNLLLFNNKVNIYMATGLLVFMLASSFFTNWGTLPPANTLEYSMAESVSGCTSTSRSSIQM